MPALHIHTSSIVPATLAVLAVAAAAAPHTASAAQSVRDARVVRVLDGDSVVLTAPGGARRYDLLGVDAPELDDCFGRAARTRLQRLLPAGSPVKVSARRRGARQVVVLRPGAGVNRLIVQSGHAESTLFDGSRLARQLDAAQERAEEAGRGMWSACFEDDAAEVEREQPDAPVVIAPNRPATDKKPSTAPQPSAPPTAPPAAPPAGQATRLSRAQFQAFVENSVFTRVRVSSDFGGSRSRSDFTFCPGGLYRLEQESVNNGFDSSFTEAGRWQLTDLTRRDDLGADQGTLRLVTEESNDPDFDTSQPQSERTFTVVITAFDNGRVAVGDDFAERSAATC